MRWLSSAQGYLRTNKHHHSQVNIHWTQDSNLTQKSVQQVQSNVQQDKLHLSENGICSLLTIAGSMHDLCFWRKLSRTCAMKILQHKHNLKTQSTPCWQNVHTRTVFACPIFLFYRNTYCNIFHWPFKTGEKKNNPLKQKTIKEKSTFSFYQTQIGL